MSTEDTQVNTVGCIVSSRNQIKYLKTLYLAIVARTCIFAVHVGTVLFCAQTKSTPKSACYCNLVFISGVTKL